MFRFLFLLFLVVPIVEIYVLIKVGSQIGALNTVALVVLTAVVGAVLIRAQGFSTIQRVQNELAGGQLPALTLMEGALILVAGALLLTPGFVTDSLGFVFLVPPWRRALVSAVAGNITMRTVRGGPGNQHPQGTVVDGEFTEEDREIHRLNRND